MLRTTFSLSSSLPLVLPDIGLGCLLVLYATAKPFRIITTFINMFNFRKLMGQGGWLHVQDVLAYSFTFKRWRS